jgi:Photosynthesis affected mutant 68
VERIPFEPIKKKKVTKPGNLPRAKPNSAQKTSNPKSKASPTQKNSAANKPVERTPDKAAKKKGTGGIPKTVSDRMVRRSALFCGVPTALGFAILIASYVVISKHLFEIPNTLVLLGSLGFTGIGVLGLSYGALSASWDENRLGTWFGASEFQKNFSYLTAAWKNQRSLQNSDLD